MDLTLSWDLFIIFFIAVVTAYSFIIGKHETLKILVAVYIAVLATQGIGNVLARFSSETEPMYRILKVMGVTMNVSSLSLAKLLIFLVAIIWIALKGGFAVHYGKTHGSLITIVATGLFGLSTATLIVTALLTFIAGAPLLDPALGSREILLPIMQQSAFVQGIILNQDLWFSLPALLLIGFGLVKEKT
ncbi:MAG: hypothetical protein AAB853_03885 [Patescibacteria group bacterium]